MKIGLIVLVLLQAFGNAQTTPLEKDPAALTVEEAKQAANAASTGEKRSRLIQGALKAERLDLIAVYLERINCNGVVRNHVKKMPASRLKEQIIILMLRSSEGWGWEPGRLPYGPQPNPPSIDNEPFASVIKKLLPGRTLTDELLQSKATRAKLASELELAMGEISPEAK